MGTEHYRVALAPSRLAAAFIVLGGGATLALVALMPLEALPKSLVTLWIGATMLDAYRTVASRRGARGVHEVRLQRGGEIAVLDGTRVERCGRLSSGSFVAPWLTVIRWRPEGARFDRTLMILPDMLARDSFRKLRVLLRW